METTNPGKHGLMEALLQHKMCVWRLKIFNSFTARYAGRLESHEVIGHRLMVRYDEQPCTSVDLRGPRTPPGKESMVFFESE